MRRESRTGAGRLVCTCCIALLLMACGSSATDKAASDKAAADKAATDKAATDKTAADKAAADKAATDKAATEKAATDKAATDKAVADNQPGCPDKLRPSVAEMVDGDRKDSEGFTARTWVLYDRIVGDDQRDALMAELVALGGARDAAKLRRRMDEESFAVEVSAKLAHRYGASKDESPLWVFPPPKREPCRMRPGRHLVYFYQHEPNFYLVRELTSECMDSKRGWPLRGIRTAEIGSCRMLASKKITYKGKLKALAGFDFASARAKTGLDPKRCALPSCQLNLAFRGVAHPNGFGAYELEVTWVSPPPKAAADDAAKDEDDDDDGDDDDDDDDYAAAECDAEVEDFYTLHVRPRAGARLVAIDAIGEITMFVDASGPRALVIGETGKLTTLPIKGDGALGKGVERVWFDPHPEEFVNHSLGPDCGL